MITANEARQLAHKTARLKEIYQLIREAAEEGKTAIYVSMPDWLMYGKDLQDKGFQGRPSSGSSELCMRLGW